MRDNQKESGPFSPHFLVFTNIHTHTHTHTLTYTHILEVNNCSDLQIPLETFALTPNHDNKIKLKSTKKLVLLVLYFC